jgi:N1221-like protein
MAVMAGLDEQDIGRQLIVKADEVDQIGTAISSPSRQLPLSPLRTIDGPSSAVASSTQIKDNAKQAIRPQLRRDGIAPPPPSQPPPPAPQPSFDPGNPTDSLSLPQLKQLVNQFPKVEQRAYAFQFADAQSFEEEVEEWFQYAEEDRRLLLSSRDSFEARWKIFCENERNSSNHFKQAWGIDEPSWLEVDQRIREQFLLLLSHKLVDADVQVRNMALESIVYILCGTWGLTAGLEGSDAQNSQMAWERNPHDAHRTAQVEWMHRGVDLISNSPALQDLHACTIRAFDSSE